MNSLISQFKFILAASCLMLAGCSSVKTVEVPVVHTEYRTDTLRTHDSIHVQTFTERLTIGDTVINNNVTKEYHYHNTYISKTDSIHDTIPYPVEVIKEVPAELSTYQKILQITGAISLLTIIIYLISLWKRK